MHTSSISLGGILPTGYFNTPVPLQNEQNTLSSPVLPSMYPVPLHS